MLPFKQRRTSQPQGSVEIDWSNPLTNGIVFASVGGAAVDLVSKEVGTQSSGASVKAHGKGIYRSFSGSAYDSYPDNARRDVTGPLTIAGLFKSSSAEAVIVSKGNAGASTNLPFALFYENTASGLNGFYFVRAGGSAVATYKPSVNIDVGALESVFCVVSNGSTTQTSPTFFVNGSKAGATSVYTNGNVAITGNASSLTVGNGVAKNPIDIGLLIISSRAWSDAEYASFYANPWQIFKPQSRSLPIPGIYPNQSWTQTRQPPTPDYEIDQQWRARQFASLIVGSNPSTELVSRKAATLAAFGTGSAPTVILGPLSSSIVGNRVDATNGGRIAAPYPALPINGDVTLIFVGGGLVDGNLIGIRSTSTTTPLIQLDVTAGAVRLLVRDNTGSIVTISAAGAATFAGSKVIIARRSGSNTSLWIDGVVVASSASAPTGALTVNSFGLFAHQAGSEVWQNSLSGFADMLGVVSLALTDAEIQSLSQNPYQIFKAKGPSLQQRAPFTPRQSKMLGTSDGAPASAVVLAQGKRVRTSQPQGVMGIDWSNPLTRGLEIALTPSSANNIATGVLATNVNTGSSTTSGGKAYSSASGRVLSIAKRPIRTFFTRAFHDESNRRWGISGSTTSNDSLYIEYSAGSLQLVRYNGTWGSSSFGTAISAGMHSLAVCSDSASSHRMYYDGYSKGSSNAAVTNYDNLLTGGLAYFQSGSYFDDPIVGQCLYLAWNRALSAVEIKSLSDNPYQIFTPEDNLIWGAP